MEHVRNNERNCKEDWKRPSSKERTDVNVTCCCKKQWEEDLFYEMVIPVAYGRGSMNCCCISIEWELESQFSSTSIFLYLVLLYNINYKKDKLIICKSRKYWDSYCKEKHNLTQCSFKFIIIYVFHTFFIILTFLFLSSLIELWIKSEIMYCSQTQNCRWWSLW